MKIPNHPLLHIVIGGLAAYAAVKVQNLADPALQAGAVAAVTGLLALYAPKPQRKPRPPKGEKPD